MKVIPAIDLWSGRVVRLYKGDPAFSKVYSDRPLEIAKRWKEQGAELIHLVDLSAALGEPDNFESIVSVLKEVDVKVEVGGGIRTTDKAKKLASLGAERIIIGTKGTDEHFLRNLIDSVGKDKVAVSVDVINSNVALKGWKDKTSLDYYDFIGFVRDIGVNWIIYTDISRDGTLEGVNLEQIKKLSAFKDLNMIVSGGISCLDDLKKLKENASFLWGVIVGKALYEDKFQLPEAIEALK